MSNSEFIDGEFIDSEVIKGLIRTNFFGMIERRNIAELEEFRKNLKRCRHFLFAIGASKEMLSIPAHALILEGRLYEMLQDISSAWQGRDEIDYEIAFNPDDGFKVATESSFSQASYTLKFKASEYDCNIDKRSPARGSLKTMISGKIEKRQIHAIHETGNEIVGNKIILDENGFAIKEVDAIRIGEAKYQTSRKRDKMNVVLDDGTIIKWDGDPCLVNDKPGNKKEFKNNALGTILRCPEANAYYKAVTGIDFVELVRIKEE